MVFNNQSHITRLKLNELRRQRERLHDEYQALSNGLAEESNPLAQLQFLYTGLQEITFANQRLHPDVANLDLFAYGNSLTSPALIEDWLARLREELNLGQQRAEFVYIFGALLEQWVNSGEQSRSDIDTEKIRNDLLNFYRATPTDTNISDELNQILQFYDDIGDDSEKVTRLSGEEFYNEPPISANIMMQISRDIYRPSVLRQDAKRFATNDLWAKELTDVLNILFSDFENWDWVETGVPVRLTWTRNKWRLFLEEDLFTAVFLERTGEFVYSLLNLRNKAQTLNRIGRLSHLLELNAPAVIVDNERRMLRESQKKFRNNVLMGWDTHTNEIDLPKDINKLAATIDNRSIVTERASAVDNIKQSSLIAPPSYGNEEYGPGIEQIAALVNAEIQIARAAYPDEPFFVIRLDIKDFYPTVPHHVIIEMLKHLDAYDPFYEKYLQMCLRDGDEVFRATQGIPNDHLISHLLGEMLLSLLDMTVQNRASAQVIRLVDDITILASSSEEAIKAWQATQDFCRASGLSINMDKTGSVVLNGEKPTELPAGDAIWMLLRLDADGEWRIDETKFNAHLEQTRKAFDTASGIIHKVSIYNENLGYLLKAIGLSARLGAVHRESVTDYVSRFHMGFSQDGRSIVDILRQLIHNDFNTAIDIPEAWFYFPLTAGGLGLTQPLIDVANRSHQYDELKPPQIPDERKADWQLKNNDWSKLYGWYQTNIPLKNPAKTTVMDALVNDFIKRGSTISAGKQHDLSPYWRWILHLYGPKILDHFGTFRYLITELVPVQLILDGRSGLTDS